MKAGNKSIRKKAFTATLPIMAGYLVLGMGFGIILRSKGYGAIWAFAMSTVIYAGSMQYLAIDLICGGAGLLTTALTTLMVNARHLFYGISMVDKYKNAGKAKPYMIYALSDETYSLVCVDMDMEEGERNKFCLLVTALDQFYWVLGSVLGSLLGAVIEFNTEGMDFALTALFVTVFVEQWLSTKDHAAALVGLAATVLCLVIFGSGSFLIPSMVAITLALTLMRKREEAVL